MSCVPTFSIKMSDNREMSCMWQEKDSYHSFHEFSTAKYESELLFTFRMEWNLFLWNLSEIGHMWLITTNLVTN